MVKTIFCYLVPNLSYKGGVTVSAQRGPTIYVTESDKRGLPTHFLFCNIQANVHVIKSVHWQKSFYYFIFIPIVLAIDSCFIHLLIPFLSYVTAI